MSQVIGQRELRNDNAEIMRRVEAGERFTVTRNGKPVADLVPHQAEQAAKRRTLADAQAAFRGLPPMDAERWRREREADDQVFGSDDPVDNVWSR
ncbi:prevent-host-death family protein [Actinokineospora alba]|uniref:Antitoxin n=1 Tax=Actinokineospora alba TaxID=504798 RepID=A0A1H0IMA6_9PSEU|nr:type II toxin-antitoxin system prevent-host-death family antitoxin [Actinokineospora alba]TDP70884.1 prevent-host-death family protein [Actinokineospora alba]SDI90887.1 prevent-host-death family protein [Actinokineospora alba]SDO32518.1 prevent-host-death family protein [Actinokineospora alba]